MSVLRVIVADDHPVFRHGLQALLGSVPDVDVVAAAATGEEAVDLAVTHRPDVMLLDLQLPGISGVEACRRIVAAAPTVRILVLTMFEDDTSVFAAVRAGATGYLLKGADAAEILRALRAVASGEAIFGQAIARRLMEYLSAPTLDKPRHAFPQLTDRELDVLQLIAQGLDNKTVADRLGLSPKTVRNHISVIFSKLQVADRAQAIVRAREAGLGTDGRPG
ncbi:MAG: response regulator transcription factor [Actinomycetota bacterium]|nr:response regulator transcription factor [Actinomycetota bacterium]